MHITSSLKMGGAEAVLCDLISSSHMQDIEHVVIYFHDGVHKKCLEQLGIAHYQVRGIIGLFDPFFFYTLTRLVAQIKPDMLHTLLWAGNNAGRLVGALLGIPVVSAWHNNLDQDGWLRNSIERITSRFSTFHIAVSSGVLASAQRLLGAHSLAGRSYVITNGINIQTIHAKSQERAISGASLGISPDLFVIGSVGRFESVKRYDLMLNAFAVLHKKYPHTRLVLVGVGSLQQALEIQANNLGLKEVITFIVGESSYSYYPLFDCFSLSSDKEGISIALLEAMSFGLPCVITYAEQYHPIIKQNGNGVLVQAGNVALLAHAWEYLIVHPQFSIKIGQSAYATVAQQFSSTRMCQEYAHIFKKALIFRGCQAFN